MKEDPLSEPDYEAMDITYEYRSLQIDAVRPRRRIPELGILEGYCVSSDSGPPSSEDDSDNDSGSEVETREMWYTLIGMTLEEWEALRRVEGKKA
jgi:hypothetical protein